MKSVLSFVLAFVIISLPAFALAQGLENPTRFGTLDQFLGGVLDAVIAIAFPIIVLFLVYVGWLFIAAQGNSEKINEAKKYLFWAIVGALIVLGAKALSLAISATVQSLTPGT